MKFGVVCDVEGKTYLDNGGTIEIGGMRYIFYVKDIKERLLTQIRIISDVDDPKRYSYHRSETARDGTFTVLGTSKNTSIKNFIQQLQTLESLLGVLGNIKRVYWNKATFETERVWIADPFGKLLKRSTQGYPQTLGTTYRPMARLISIITSTERRSCSRESRVY
jgi:hypothetical protein